MTARRLARESSAVEGRRSDELRRGGGRHDPGSFNGRTPRSERGDRGSSPCPGAPCPTRDSARALRPGPRRTRGCSSAVERSPETRGAAGSIPAGHICLGFVAQLEEPPSLERCGAGSTPAEAILGRAAGGAARSLRSQGRILLPPFRSGVVERQDARLLTARRRFDPCRRSSALPPWSKGDDAGPSTRKLRVRIPPGVLPRG